MPKPIIPCLIALVLPAFAAAQNSQTTCYMLGNQLHCQTYGQPQVNPGPTFDPSAISRIPAMTDPTRGIEEAYAIRQQQLQIQQQELQNQQIEQQMRAQQQQEAEAQRLQAEADASSQALAERTKLVMTRYAAIIDVLAKSKPCVDRFPHDSARFDQCLLDLSKQDPDFAAHLQMVTVHKDDADYWKGLH